MEDTLRTLVALALTLLLILHRLEASTFGAAEYDEPDHGRPPSLMRRLAWYAIGIAGIVAILWVAPDASHQLYLGTGNRLEAIVYGLLLGTAGAAQAAAISWSRYHRLRLPDLREYPGALANELVTAFVDEAVFRGAALGFLILAGIDPTIAIVIQAIVYTLSTRLGAPGRDPYMFGLSIAIGLVAGWVTVLTGGFAAAFIGHATTRVAVFLTTGHAGQPTGFGREVEDVERRRRIPEGWRVVGPREGGRGRS